MRARSGMSQVNVLLTWRSDGGHDWLHCSAVTTGRSTTSRFCPACSTLLFLGLFAHDHLLVERLQFNVIRNKLTPRIPVMTPRVAAEIKFGFSRSWVDDTEWKEVRVWTSALHIVAGAANGAFCGPPLCTSISLEELPCRHS